MAHEPEGRFRSPIVGDLNLPPEGTTGDEGPSWLDPHERVPMLVELNVLYPGGLGAVRDAFYEIWMTYAHLTGGWPSEEPPPSSTQPPVPAGLELIAPKLYQCVLSRLELRNMVDDDQQRATGTGRPPAIFRVWPDYTLEPQIDRSAPTVKADAAWRS